MRKSVLCLPMLAIVFLVQCKTSKVGTGSTGGATAVVTRQGFIDCFEEGLTANGQPVWCEASAVLYDGNKLIFANDKDMPDQRSSVFYWTFKNGFADTSHAVSYMGSPVLKKIKKFEDFASTPDRKIAFLSTAFDRVKPGTTEWDSYNTIVYWQVGNENNPQVLNGSTADSTSVFLRERISKALKSTEFPDGMPYFKVEGLAATENLLYFGVREDGKKFDDFKYRVKVLTAPYAINNGKVEIANELKLIADLDISQLEPSLKDSMGLSSIEYDPYNKRFLILTSFESPERLGAYIWTATASELENNKMNLVKDAQGNAIAFANKGEDIAIINRRKIIIVNDDDRMKTTFGGQTRQPNQASYSILEFR